MDRDKPNLTRMQMNFIDYLVSPLFGALSHILPRLQIIVDKLEENKSKWKMLLESETKVDKEESPETPRKGNNTDGTQLEDVDN